MAQKYIWLKMTKEWGGFGIDEIVRFGESKGVERISAGFGVEVAEPQESKKAATAAKAKAAKAKAAKDTAAAKIAEEAKIAEQARVAAAAEKAKKENADNRP